MMKRTIYFARCIATNGADMSAIKIGCSTFESQRRLKAVASRLPFDCELLADCRGGYFHENLLHMMFREERIGGEYFRESARLTEFIKTVRATGKLPLAVQGADDGFVGLGFITMEGMRAFVRRHHVTVEDMVALSGTKHETWRRLLLTDDAPNQRLIAAAALAALEKGRRIRWPGDFLPKVTGIKPDVLNPAVFSKRRVA